MNGEQTEIPTGQPYTRRQFEEKLEREFLEGKVTPQKIDPEARLAIQQAADLLGVTRRTLYTYNKQGLVQIEHDDKKGKPFVRRRSIDSFLDTKNAGIKKTEYVPDGCIVIKEEAWHRTRETAEQLAIRVATLSTRVENLLTYEKQVEDDAAEIARLKEENERLKARGLWSYLRSAFGGDGGHDEKN